MTESTLITYRDMILNVVPRWLRKGSVGAGLAGKILYAIGVQLDAVSDALVAGVKRRFPGYQGQYDSLPLLGIERRIARGPFETDAGYAARLLPWLDAHATRGGPYAMISQLFGFWQGAFPIALVYRTGKRFTLNTDGTITRDYVAGWVDTTPYQAHWWLFLQWSSPVGNDGLWGSVGSSGDPHWGDGGLWGTDLAPIVVQNILLVPTEWNSAHAFGTVSLIAPANWAAPSTWPSVALVSIPIG